MSFQRKPPYVDPRARRGRLLSAMLRSMNRPATAAFETSLFFRWTAWRIVPRLMRLTGGRFAALVPLPIGVIETRDARNGRPHRRAVLYFNDGNRIVVVPSKAGWHEDPYWFQNAVADPKVRFESRPFRAEVVEEPAARERLWDLVTTFYPPEAAYRERAARSGRTIPILQLVPEGAG